MLSVLTVILVVSTLLGWLTNLVNQSEVVEGVQDTVSSSGPLSVRQESKGGVQPLSSWETVVENSRLPLS